MFHVNALNAFSSMSTAIARLRMKACEQRIPSPAFPVRIRVTYSPSYQVWGVTEEYFKAHVFPDASDALLSTLGSVSGMVCLGSGLR